MMCSFRIAAMVLCLAAWKAWSAPLMLQQYDETEPAVGCSRLNLLQQSSTVPKLHPGSNFVAHCSFAFSPSSGFRRPNVAWYYGLQPLGSDFLLNRNATIFTEWANSSTSSQQTVTTNISIPNISSTDQGLYTARVWWNHCGAKAECRISLSTMNRCYRVTPTVTGTNYYRKIVAPDPKSPRVSIQVEYSGDTDVNHFDVLWQLNSTGNLVDTDKEGRFQSSRQPCGICSFNETLTIKDASDLDSGRYTAYVSSNKSNTNATIDLQIIPWPTVTGWPGEIVHLDKTRILSYHLANFTAEFISLVVVKDDAVIESYDSIVIDIHHHPLEHKSVTVDVTVPKGAAGRYQLCYQFTGNVSTTHNEPWYTNHTTVTAELPRSKMSFKAMAIALSAAIGFFVFIFTICVAAVKLKSWRSRNPQTLEERNPLVYPPRSRHLPQYESVKDRVKSIRSRDTDPEDHDNADCPPRNRSQCESDQHQTKSTGSSTPLWKQVPAEIISDSPNMNQFMVSVAREFGHWETLARCLGLSEPDVVAIQENNRGNHEEQKYQMILKWCKRNGSAATLQKLVHCVEVTFGDRELAKRIAFIINEQFMTKLIS